MLESVLHDEMFVVVFVVVRSRLLLVALFDFFKLLILDIELFLPSRILSNDLRPFSLGRAFLFTAKLADFDSFVGSL